MTNRIKEKCSMCEISEWSNNRSSQECPHVANQSKEIFIGLDRQRKEESDVCDVTIFVKDTQLKAHMCVLVCCSRFFQAFFSQRNLSDSNGKEVRLDLDLKAVAIILDFIYTGKLAFEFEDIENVLQAADYLLIEDLRLYVQNYLEAILSVNTCLKIMLLSNTYNFQTLYSAACDIFKSRVFDYIYPKKLFNLHNFAEMVKLLQDPIVSSTFNNKVVDEIVSEWFHTNNVSQLDKSLLVELEKVMHVRGLDLSLIKMRGTNCSLKMADVNHKKPRKRKQKPGSHSATKTLACPGTLSTVTISPDQLDKKLELLITNGDGGHHAYILEQDRWVKLPPLPDIRRNHKMVQMGHEVYLLGGSQTAYIPSESCFSLVDLTWRSLPPTTHVFLNVEDAVVTPDEQVCLLGQTAIGERYDPVSKTWSPLSHYKVGNELSELRAASDGQRLFICFTEEEIFNADISVRFSEYNFEENQWVALPHPPIPPQRRIMSPNNNPIQLGLLENYKMFISENKIYLCNVQKDEDQRRIFEYDLDMGQWSQSSPNNLRLDPLPSPKNHQIKTSCWLKGSCIIECDYKRHDWTHMMLSQSSSTSRSPLEWKTCASPPFMFNQNHLVLCHVSITSEDAVKLLSLPTATYSARPRKPHTFQC